MGAKHSAPVDDEAYAKKNDDAPVTQDEKVQDLTRYYTEEKKRMTDSEKDQHDVTRENMQLLKQLFKKMDPTVMKSTSEVQGEINLSFKYDFSKELLLVKVIKCRDLGLRDIRGRTSSPYVRLFMYPDKHKAGSKTTQISQNPSDPTFHEIFDFPLEDPELDTTKLVVQVWDQDIMGRDDFMGEHLVSFADIDFQMVPVHTQWYTLQMETDLCITGDIEISLTYQLPSSLYVTVHKANGLLERDIDEKPSSFVKISIPGVAKVYETQVQKQCVDPVWEETFEFDVPQEEFEFRYITFHVLDYGEDGLDLDSLGQVIIDLNNFNPDTGYQGTFGLSDMRNNDRLKSKWFQSETVQEFREALVAHASVQYPKFLFSKHSGEQIVTVVSKKAGAQAKLRIVNGIPVS